MKKSIADSMTLQEQLDYVAEKLIMQGNRCEVDGHCAYGDGKGNHCGVGWMLDEGNSTLMDSGYGVKRLAEQYPSLVPQSIPEHVGLWQRIQQLHDKASGRGYTLEYLKRNYKIINWDKWDRVLMVLAKNQSVHYGV